MVAQPNVLVPGDEDIVFCHLPASSLNSNKNMIMAGRRDSLTHDDYRQPRKPPFFGAACPCTGMVGRFGAPARLWHRHPSHWCHLSDGEPLVSVRPRGGPRRQITDARAIHHAGTVDIGL